MRPALKICGLTREADVSLCCGLGVDICGFVTEYPVAVPWNLTEDACAALLRAVRKPAKSCVVTGGGREKICTIARRLKPDFIQLHYMETLEDTAAIARELDPLGIGVIKTLPASAGERVRQFGETAVEACVEKLCKAGVYAILVDPRGPSNAGAKGVSADLAFFRQVQAVSSCPVILAGGITPENCLGIVRGEHPAAIDIMTGVETEPGIKSEALLAKLMRQIQE